MKIISTTDLSRDGTDCFIHESISLVEQFEMYFIIKCWKVVGWSSAEEVEIVFTSDNLGKVTEKYYDLGGKL